MLPVPFDMLPASAISSTRLDAGLLLFRRGDPAKALFLLRTGRIDLLRYSRSGEVTVIHRAGAGESFAEAALFSPHYHCDAQAGVAADLYRIDKPAVLELMRTEPDFALAMSARFARQIQEYRRRLELLAIHNARTRVYAGVSEGLLTGDIKGFAAQIGLTHEATYRALARLVRAGKLVKTGRGIYRMPRS